MAVGKPRGRWPVRRFVVAEASMEPALSQGDGLIAWQGSTIRRGEIRVFEHPDHQDFWLVKRVGHVRGDGFEALSDNPGAGAVDSNTFGDVGIDGSYRVLGVVRPGSLPRRVRPGVRS
jgi:hypothetical protein